MLVKIESGVFELNCLGEDEIISVEDFGNILAPQIKNPKIKNFTINGISKKLIFII